MTVTPSLAPLLERFFMQRLITQRRASPNTIASYRDTFRLLLQFDIDPIALVPDIAVAEIAKHPGGIAQHRPGEQRQCRVPGRAAVHALVDRRATPHREIAGGGDIEPRIIVRVAQQRQIELLHLGRTDRREGLWLVDRGVVAQDR